MRGPFIVFLFSFCLCGLVHAEEPSDDVIVNTIQCEAGRVGKQLATLKEFPANLKVIVSWTSSDATDAAGSLGFKFPIFNWGASGDLDKKDTDTLNSDGLSFNLHSDNLKVCKGYKKDIVKEGIGVYDCLIKRKLASLRAAVEGGTGSAGCKHQVTMSKKLSGNLKLNLWGVDLGPSASWGHTYDFTFIIAAPPPKK